MPFHDYLARNLCNFATLEETTGEKIGGISKQMGKSIQGLLIKLTLDG